MGVDMGFNATHTPDKDAGDSFHTHATGEKHHHDEEGSIDLDNIKLTVEKHQHTNKISEHHHDSKGDSEKDDCCHDKVIKLQNLDKKINQNSKAVFNTPVFTVIINNFFGVVILNYNKTFPEKTRIPFFYPPPPDILISIQRFQI